MFSPSSDFLSMTLFNLISMTRHRSHKFGEDYRNVNYRNLRNIFYFSLIIESVYVTTEETPSSYLLFNFLFLSVVAPAVQWMFEQIHTKLTALEGKDLRNMPPELTTSGSNEFHYEHESSAKSFTKLFPFTFYSKYHRNVCSNGLQLFSLDLYCFFQEKYKNIIRFFFYSSKVLCYHLQIFDFIPKAFVRGVPTQKVEKVKW